MGVRIARIVTVALWLVCSTGLASADTMVVAGRKVPSPAPFAFTPTEAFAPLLAALPALRGSYVLTPDRILITTAGRREVAISRQRPEATLDGVVHPLPALPRQSGAAILLPVKAVANLLGCAARWDEPNRVIYLNPLIRTFTVQSTPDSYRVVIAGDLPLRYRESRLQDPPRLVLDLSDVELAEPFAPYKVEGSHFLAARIAQHALAPDPKGDVTRVVLDFAEWKPYRLRLSEDRCQLVIEVPLPGRDLPAPPAPPVTLSDLTFRRYSAQFCTVTLAATGKAHVACDPTSDPTSVCVDIENATNDIRPDRLTIQDQLVKGVALGPAPDKPGVQRLTLSLAQATPYAISADRSQIRLVLGTCELSDLTIAIDAGHGGNDTGAIGRSGLMEKEVTLDIALRVGQLLEQAGAKVVYTRTGDSIVKPLEGGGNGSRTDQLYARCAIANGAPADLFVSIHCNARGKDPMSIRGTETYYRKSDSVEFARVMQQEVVRALGTPDGGARYHPKSIVVLYRTGMPAVLVETAYLSHPTDEALLAEESFREQAAQGIVSGIKRYATESDLLASVLRQKETGSAAPGS